MTKSDYKQFVEKNFTFLAISDAYSLIDYIFEKGIEEPKTCEGCYHSTIFNESFRNCPCLCLIDEDVEPTSVVPNEFHCDLFEPKVIE